jgi:hypothetical protein
MTTLNVQFADSSKAKIIAYFAGPQDPDIYSNLGTVDTDSSTWATFYAAAGGEVSLLPAPTTT